MASNAINVIPGTVVIFADAGFTGEDVVISLTSLADTVGRLSARYDFGAGVKPARVTIYGEFQAVATPTLNDTLFAYAAWWSEDGDAPGGIGTADAAITTVKAANLDPIGAAICDAAAADTIFTLGPKIIDVKGRYLSLAVVNDLGSALTADDAENFLKVYPWPLEIE